MNYEYEMKIKGTLFLNLTVLPIIVVLSQISLLESCFNQRDGIIISQNKKVACFSYKSIMGNEQGDIESSTTLATTTTHSYSGNSTTFTTTTTVPSDNPLS